MQALLEVLGSLQTPDVLEVVKVAVGVHACANKSVPVHALQLDVCVVHLEREVQSLAEINVWPFNSVQVFASGLKLIEVKILWEHFHFYFINYIPIQV